MPRDDNLPTFMPQTILETDDEAEPGDSEGSESKPVGMTAEQLQEILANQRQLSENSLRQILQGAQPKNGVPLQEEDQFPELKVDPVGLPHPASDLEGFIKGWQERSDKALKSVLAQVTQRVTERAVTQASQVADTKSLTNRAFDMIREVAPDLDDDVIQFAAQRVAEGYRERGVDPMSALRADLVGVAQEVLDYADSRFGARPEDAETRPLQRRGSNGSGGRTGGISPGRGRLPQPAPRGEESAGDMVAELKQFQHKARIY
jgi:hypothetical protein